MRAHLAWLGPGLLAVALLSSSAEGVGPPRKQAATRAPDALTLARQIDRRLDAELKARGVPAAPMAGDAEFLRRVYLDLAGRIPRVSEVRAFLDDKRADKRARLIDKLLEGPNYVTHLTNVYRALLLPRNNDQNVQFLAGQIERWVRPRIRDNVAWDKMVRELLTARVGNIGMGRGPAFAADQTGATAFYQANENKADNLAAAASRIFLGVKIECAQCHDHPFAKWTRRQFWETAAFFAGVRPQNAQAGIFGGAVDDPKVREITQPGSERKIKAKFLDGTSPAWTEESDTRAVFADWVTRGDNPFFAKAAANRLWEHFFGIGLVDPVDDMREENPATHPELLDDMAKGLVAAKFDLKYLIRAITLSKAYQRTSEMTDKLQEDVRLFARMPLKGLTPEQIWDSLVTAVAYKEPPGPNRGFQMTAARQEFITKFANPVDRRTETSTSILQALALMNGKFISDATSLDRSETLAAVLDAPFLGTAQKLDTLYLAALGRPMRPKESSRLVPYVNGGGPSRNTNKALADVFWVLLNSSEFILNH